MPRHKVRLHGGLTWVRGPPPVGAPAPRGQGRDPIPIEVEAVTLQCDSFRCSPPSAYETNQPPGGQTSVQANQTHRAASAKQPSIACICRRCSISSMLIRGSSRLLVNVWCSSSAMVPRIIGSGSDSATHRPQHNPVHRIDTTYRDIRMIPS